ncbi:MAG: YgeY family selenium metabolism-linked hydrolase [SAR324 cluster bacterium]|nr:YgeY family selenium metabolism-linked hydrolase [SAR324 cluster bacterium]
MAAEIRAKAAEYKNYTAQLLSELVQIKSYSSQEQDVCARITEMCREAGFDTVRTDALGSVIASIGKGPKMIVFDGHIDTVEVGERKNWQLDPFSGLIKDGKIHGRGSADQKGGAASMIAAGRILKELAYAGQYTVLFTFTVMEEDCDGMCWKYLIEEEKIEPDFWVSTEPTSCQLYRGHRGRMEIQCTFRGISSHGSAPERGVSAAYKVARAALAIEKLNESLQPDEDNFLGKGTAVVSQIVVNGPSQCAVPDYGMLYIDRRLTWGETAESAIQQVKDVMGEDVEVVEMPKYVKKGYKNFDYGQELYFPTWKIEENHPLVQGGIDAYRALYQKAPNVDKWTFSTNGVSVCGRHKIPAIGFGPGDEAQAHAPNEFNRTEDLEICAAFYANLVYQMDNIN